MPCCRYCFDTRCILQAEFTEGWLDSTEKITEVSSSLIWSTKNNNIFRKVISGKGERYGKRRDEDNFERIFDTEIDQ